MGHLQSEILQVYNLLHSLFPSPSCWCAAVICKKTWQTNKQKQPSLLPGDPDAEFASAEVEDDSDVDVDELLELDAKGNVINGNYGKVYTCVRF